MSKRIRRNHAPEFKAKVAWRRGGPTPLAALAGASMCTRPVTAWKEQLIAAAADAFAEGGRCMDRPSMWKSLRPKMADARWRKRF